MFYGRGAGGLPDRLRGARRRHRRRGQPGQGHARRRSGTLGTRRAPADRRPRLGLLPQPRGASTGPACSPRWPACSAPRRVDPLDGAGGPRRRGPPHLHHPRRPRGRRAQPRCTTLRGLDVVDRDRLGRCASIGDERSGTDEVRLHPRRGARSSASATCCSPAWPPTAGSTCPRRGRRSRRSSGLRGRPTPRSPSRSCGPSSRATIDARRRSSASSPTAYATFDHPEVCPVVPLGDGLRPARAVPGPDARVQGRRAAARRAGCSTTS